MTPVKVAAEFGVKVINSVQLPEGATLPAQLSLSE
jgi:hypothetical protein